jgi:hypothetical protein
VLVVTEREGGWRVTGVYMREPGGAVVMHPRWPRRWSGTAEVETEWKYLAERARDGSGGNYYSWELEGYEVADTADVDILVTARAAEIVALTHGPLGETAGTIGPSWAIDIAVMPFVVLRDDLDRPVLVAAGDPHRDATVTIAGGPAPGPTPFASCVHWQRAGDPCWLLTPDVTHRVTWDGGAVDLLVDHNAQILCLTVATRG